MREAPPVNTGAKILPAGGRGKDHFEMLQRLLFFSTRSVPKEKLFSQSLAYLRKEVPTLGTLAMLSPYGGGEN